MRASKNIFIVIVVAVVLLSAWALTADEFAAPDGADATPDPAVATGTDGGADAALPGDAPVLLVVGDSLSAGYGLGDVDDGWVALLQERLRREGYAIRVVNASISGDTTAGGLARLPAALERFEPAVTILELGGNDGLRGFPLEEMRDNLAQMIALAQGAGSRVVLLEMMIPTNYGPRYTDDFRGRFTSLAERFDIPLVPFILEDIALDETLMQRDGIHPGEAAQPMMLDAVWPVVEPVVRALPETTDKQG